MLLPVKNNLVGEMEGMAYRLRPAEKRTVAKVEWEGKGVSQTADEALAAEGKPKVRKLSVLEQAAEFLQEVLADGPRRVKDIELMAEMMYGIKRRTLVRAHKALYIKYYREKRRGEVWMRLPSVKEIEEKMRKNSGTVGTHTENPGNQGTLSHEVCVPSGTHRGSSWHTRKWRGSGGRRSPFDKLRAGESGPGDGGNPSASSGQVS